VKDDNDHDNNDDKVNDGNNDKTLQQQ
jgi:hypothetical protein